MDIRHPVHPEHGKTMDTKALRDHFLVEKLFVPGKVHMTYSHIDRIIITGIMPEKAPLQLQAGKEIGGDFLFQRREGGVINIGGAGEIQIDGKTFPMDHRDGFYIGKGAEEVTFSSNNPSEPAKFYLLSGPAHAAYPHKKVSQKDAKQVHLGSKSESNKRTIYQYIHPAVLESCQLCMGMTLLEPENVWNTMPTHTHDRRMEVYLYFDLSKEGVVFHFMGEPQETRHIIVRNEEAVINPSWSIHSGAGTSNYTFIWGMVGENQTFTDMDHVPMEDLK